MEGENARVDLGGGLQRYMALADETARELLGSDNPLVQALLQYDAFFRADLWAHRPPQPTMSFLLYLNAYQMFLASARSALSGHPAAIFPVLRTALESACYGYLIEQQPDLAEIWRHRQRSKEDRKACRDAFTLDKAIKSLDARAPDIYRLAKEVYESAIDYGAHPNVLGVAGHVSFDDSRDDGFTALIHTSLYGAAHHEANRGICACLDFGLAIIGIILLADGDLSESRAADLNKLNQVKEAAISEYQTGQP